MINGIEGFQNRALGTFSRVFLAGSMAWKLGEVAVNQIQSMMEANEYLALPSAQLELPTSSSIQPYDPIKATLQLIPNNTLSTSIQVTAKDIGLSEQAAPQSFNTTLIETAQSATVIGSTALSIPLGFAAIEAIPNALTGGSSVLADHCASTIAGALATADCIVSHAGSAVNGALETAVHTSSSYLPYVAIGAVGAGALLIGKVAMDKIKEVRKTNKNLKTDKILNKWKQTATAARGVQKGVQHKDLLAKRKARTDAVTTAGKKTPTKKGRSKK